jgi:inosine/xanthosine triphosphate pyrophosphatase family protein
MTGKRPIKIVYCSWSDFKKEEWKLAKENLELESEKGKKLQDIFELEFRKVPTAEPLLCNLEEMVKAKIESAYRQVQVPCIVEHAGLVLEGYEDKSFPGGLTQPMWDSLDAEKFVSCCSALSVRAIARAVVGYCDGMNIKIFVGETRGVLSAAPRGDREFYWDTVFCPDGENGKTYAEIVGADRAGLLTKLKISQSMSALKQFFEYRLTNEANLFPAY